MQAIESFSQGQKYYQIIKIWELTTPHKVKELHSRIIKSLSVYSPQYLDRCRHRTNEPPYKPQTWENDSLFLKYCVKCTSQSLSKLEDADVEQSCSLMKSYLFSSNIARMLLQADESSHLVHIY